MSELLPLFPLPNVVLFPNVFLPLHIFEPRYRDMVAAAEAGDRMIGMVLLQPGWEGHYEGRPPVYPIGCSGVMTHVERLTDGRYNLVLRGVERFRIVTEDVSEDQQRSYRRAVVEPLLEPPLTTDARQALRICRSRLESLLAPATDRAAELRTPLGGSHRSRAGEASIPSAMTEEDLVNTLAQYLDLEPIEKQALLEQAGLRARAESLVELLEMKILMARTPGLSHLAH
jgi:Lon protease-like protein